MVTYGGNKRFSSRQRSASTFARERKTSEIINQSHITPSKQQPTDYPKALLAPHIYKNIKIPDLTCYPSTTFTEEEHLSWLPGPLTGGESMYIGLTPGVWVTTIHPTVLAASGISPAIPVAGSYGSQQNIIAQKLHTRYKAARLVSAMASITYIGNGDSNQGLVTCSYVPFGKAAAFTSTALVPGTSPVWNGEFDRVLIKDYVDSYQGPLKNGAVVFYKPVDSNSFRYVNLFDNSFARSASQASSNGAGSSGQGSVTVEGLFSNQSNGFGYFVFNLEGESRDFSAFDVKIVANWEAIPNDDDTDAVITASPTNAAAASAGLSLASVTPTAGSTAILTERASLARSIRY